MADASNAIDHPPPSSARAVRLPASPTSVAIETETADDPTGRTPKARRTDKMDVPVFSLQVPALGDGPDLLQVPRDAKESLAERLVVSDASDSSHGEDDARHQGVRLDEDIDVDQEDSSDFDNLLEDNTLSDEDEDLDDDLSDDEGGAPLEETLRRIQRQDPTTTSLAVRSVSNTIGGCEAGRIVGDSAHLKELTIAGDSMDLVNDPSAVKWLVELCAGVSQNASLEHLAMKECTFTGGANDAINGALASHIQRNDILHALEITDCSVGEVFAPSIAGALQRRRCKRSLQRIVLDATGMCDEQGRDLVEALRGYDHLTSLSLGDNALGPRSCAALRDFLPDSKLTALNLDNNSIDDEGIAALTAGVIENATLTELVLSFNTKISHVGWDAFAACLKDDKSVIEKLDISSNNITDAAARAFGSCLRSNSNLKKLGLYDLTSDGGTPLITQTGWEAFFGGIQHSAIEEIDLRYSTLGEGALPVLTRALASGRVRVKVLDLGHNGHLTKAEWRSFFAQLNGPRVSLEELHLHENGLADDAMPYLASMIKGNATLHTVSLDDNPSVTSKGWSHVARRLCDASSIERIRGSNHTLRSLGDVELPSELRALLEGNRLADKGDVARRKILRHHFKNGAAKVHEVAAMEMNVLSQAMAWMGKDGAGGGLLYEVLRGQPSLLASGNTGRTSGTKRKRAS